jgi:hypothetical protein
MDDGAFPSADRLPAPAELAALGSVLFLHPETAPCAPQAWATAVRAELHASVDAAGTREWIAWMDAGGACLGRLYLLPDTDFLAWESLVQRLPQCAVERRTSTESLCRRLRARLSAGRWRAVALRLRAIARGAHWMLQAAPTPLSSIGLEVAHAITRVEDAQAMLAPSPDLP